MTVVQAPPYPPARKPLLPVWARVTLYVIACLLVMSAFSMVFYFLVSHIPDIAPSAVGRINFYIYPVISVTVVTLCAWLFLKYIDRQPFSVLGLSIKGRFSDCIAGVLFAVALYIVGFGIVWGTGAVSIGSVNVNIPVLIGTFLFFFVAAAMEEIMIRGYILGRLMTVTNKFVALAISSAIFSVMHLGNPNIGALPLINLFLAGLLLGAAYLYTKNLWFPIMLHVAWNWIQGPVLGFEVSGSSIFPTMLTLNLPENNIINGGSFGFEGSIVCTAICLLGTLAIIAWYERENRKLKDSAPPLS